MVITTDTFVTGDMVAFAEKYLGDTRHWRVVREASDLWRDGQWEKARKLLDSLPTKGKLLKQLVEKLKGKSVYKTLKKIEEGSLKKGPKFLKGLFSLGSHIAIEVERGNKEYRMLYPVIYEKLGEILYNE